MIYLQYPSWITPEIIPGLPFRWYGLMYLVAFAVAYALFMYQVRKKGLKVDTEEITNFFFWAIVGVLIGGRLFSAILYDPTHTYVRKPWLIFWPFDNHMRFIGFQGMSYHGGLVGAIVAITLYARRRKLNLLVWGDLLAASVPLGYTFGRLGNFINGELWGRVTTAPWGMVFPNADRVPASASWVAAIAHKVGINIEFANQLLNLPRHPSQLYEALFEGVVLWLVIWFVFRPRTKFPGQIMGIYVIGYGIARFIVEYFREPDAGIGFVIKLSRAPHPPQLFVTPFDFTMGQVLSFLMIIGGIVMLVIFRRMHMVRPQIQTFAKSEDVNKDTAGAADSTRGKRK